MQRFFHPTTLSKVTKSPSLSLKTTLTLHSRAFTTAYNNITPSKNFSQNTLQNTPQNIQNFAPRKKSTTVSRRNFSSKNIPPEPVQTTTTLHSTQTAAQETVQKSSTLSPGLEFNTTTTPEQMSLPTNLPRFKSFQDFSTWYCIDPPSYQRFSSGWWLSNSWLMLMYSVTGYSALLLVRKILSLFGIENTGLFKGEYHHRFVYFLMMTPMYSLLTLVYGRIFGRPVYTQKMVKRIWGRFLPWMREKK
jgi:hypothetical protein